MAELGLFPLPIVLLPTEQVPLHIFEDRYKELIVECLADSRPFGVLLAVGNNEEDVIRSGVVVVGLPAEVARAVS